MSKLTNDQRSALNMKLAKAIAYHDSGKAVDANQWARELVMYLEALGILQDEYGPTVK